MSRNTAETDLNKVPSVDRLLNAPQLTTLVASWGRASVHAAISAIQAKLRNDATAQPSDDIESFYRKHVESWLREHRLESPREVFNLTGTILHTNLGRAIVDEQMYERAKRLITRPASIEFNLTSGKRGQRESAVCERLCRLVGAEAAAIMNNNAAAVLITLHTFARERNVVVSRGELIEIGGSFRLPEIMEAAGCHLVEVGTTNRTHLQDYEKALGTEPALLLKIHPSNFRVEGFTKSVGVAELKPLAHKSNLPLIVDLGSGALIDTTQFGLPREPMPGTTLNEGADLVTFSGDKLLGGPQAGLIVGSQELIDAINANPLKRALRTSKLTLALLDETFKAYEDVARLRTSIPTLRLLGLSDKELRHRAKLTHARLAERLANEVTVSVEPSDAEVGSGAMPGESLSSVAVVLQAKSSHETERLFAQLRELPTPVIGRQYKGSILLDMRGAEPLDEFLANLDSLT